MRETTARRLGRRGEARELLDAFRSLLVGELLAPSGTLYLVAPWVTDVVVLDNHTHAFSSLDPAWGAAPVRLSQVLARLAELGARVVVATHPHPRVQGFRERVRESLAPGVGPPTVLEEADLGECGVLGEGFYLYGVLHLTEQGVTAAEEGVILHTDPALLAQTHARFAARWLRGGAA